MTEPEQPVANEDETKATELVELISTHLKTAEDSLAKVAKTVEEIDAYVAIFKDARAKFDDPNVGVEASLVSSQNNSSEIVTLKTTAENNLAQIKDALASVQVNIEEMTKAHADFVEIKTKIDDGQTGLSAVLVSATALQQEIDVVKGQSTGLYLAIQKLRDESSTHAAQIVKLREEAEIDTGKIKDNEKISQDSKDKILEFYEIATGASLAGSFDTRKKELADSVKLWYGTLAWSTFVLFASVVGIYLTSFYGGFVGINIFLPRILLTSPLIFFTAFATQRYTHERNILERYAFKSATASALESYTKLLKNTFKSSEAEKRILDFVVDSMTVIYKEPFDTKNESKISLGINPKSGDIKGEITETKEAIESVKKIVTTQEEGI